MLEQISFENERFNEHNTLWDLTKNTIILCEDVKMMHKLAEEICHTVNGCTDDYPFSANGKAKTIMCFGLQHKIEIGRQTITLSVEPAIVYKADSLDDLWLYTSTGNCESIYPVSIYKGSYELFDESKDKIYEMIVNGRCGFKVNL